MTMKKENENKHEKGSEKIEKKTETNKRKQK
jgi:hypothetical protein